MSLDAFVTWVAFGGIAQKAFDPSKHPHQPKGSPTGGEFAPKAGGEASASEPAKEGAADVLPYAWVNKQPALASQITGNFPTRNGAVVPVKTIKKWHVTPRENVESILKNGFDLTRVKPLWQNDYAISLGSGSQAQAEKYFTRAGQQFDTAKYALLEVTVRGRFFDHKLDASPGNLGSAKAYTAQMVKDGWDASDQIYVYNPRAITRIRQVK